MGGPGGTVGPQVGWQRPMPSWDEAYSLPLTDPHAAQQGAANINTAVRTVAENLSI